MKGQTKKLAISALLLAADVILTRLLAFNTPLMKIGLGFAATALCALLYGPWWTAGLAALADLLGSLLFPTGAYFPGFTLTSFLMGLVFGLFLYKKQGWLQGLAAVGINQFILGLFLNTFWISLLYGSPYVPLLATRVFQSILLSVVQLICIQLMVPILNRYGKKVSVT